VKKRKNDIQGNKLPPGKKIVKKLEKVLQTSPKFLPVTVFKQEKGPLMAI